MNTSEKITKLQTLRDQIVLCKRCSLHKTRINTVLGEGDCSAKIMFIGEAPGQNEDLKGKPFVGRAGAILDELLESVNLKREQIYTCNILKCRPPENRIPMSGEIRNCIGSLDIQIKVINPQVIVTLGNFATTYIFDKFGLPQAQISMVHGRVFEVVTPFGLKKVIPLFHPAAVTSDASKIQILKKDFKIFKNV
jgi:uracil-DNA glycosylase